MKTLLLFFLALAVGEVSADSPGPSLSGTGALYLTYDVGMSQDLQGVLVGRFVPDAGSLPRFPAVTTGRYPGPVSYITLRPTTQDLETLVGTDETDLLSHDTLRIVKIPVRIVLNHYEAVVECDARSYRATLVSVKRLGNAEVVTRDASPIGC
jgi:hypothetical protein